MGFERVSWLRRRWLRVTLGLMLAVFALSVWRVYPVLRLAFWGVPTGQSEGEAAQQVPVAQNGPVDASVYRGPGVIRQEVDMASLAAHRPIPPRSAALAPDLSKPEVRAQVEMANELRRKHLEESLKAIAENPAATERWKESIASKYGKETEKTKGIVAIFEQKQFAQVADALSD